MPIPLVYNIRSAMQRAWREVSGAMERRERRGLGWWARIVTRDS